MSKTIITLTGMSCSGKSHLADYISKNANGLLEAVSTTTRGKRAGEEHGSSYYFVSQEEFESIKSNDAFLEHAAFGKNQYGLSLAEMNRIFSLGMQPISVVEPIGANNIRERAPKHGISVLNVYIDCPLIVSLERWHERFKFDQKAGLANEDFYAERIAMTLAKESAWKGAVPYGLTLPYASTEAETRHQISMIMEAVTERPEPRFTPSLTERDITPVLVENVKKALIKIDDSKHFATIANKIRNSPTQSYGAEYQ